MTTLTDPASAPRSTQGPTLTEPHYRRHLGLPRERWVQYAVLAFLAVLVLAPVVPTIYQSILDRPLYEVGGIFTA